MQKHMGIQKKTAILSVLIILLFASIPLNNQAQDSIDWHSYSEGMELAKEKDKPIFIDFWAPWCGPCQEMEEEVYPDQRVIDKSKNFVNIKVNTEENSDLANQYGVQSIPTLVFLTSDGEELFRRTGARDVEQLLSDMDEALSSTGNGELPIDWTGYDQGRKEADNQDKPVMIDFFTVDCDDCSKMRVQTYSDSQVAEKANDDFIPVRVNATEEANIADLHNVDTYPTVLFLSPDGDAMARLEGFAGPSDLLSEMDDVLEEHKASQSASSTTGEDNSLSSDYTPYIFVAAVAMVAVIILNKKFKFF